MKNKIIYGILLFLIILISFVNILFFMRFDILTEHDLGYLYNRDFFNPEHGRYLATFLGSLVTERIPNLLNMHTNDFQPIYSAGIKGIFVILMCIVIANSGFLFKKDNSQKFLNSAYISTYAIVYLLLFNCFFFYENRQFEVYFNILENTVFFEYPLSILWYTILISSLCYFWINKKDISIPKYILLLLNTFMVGISVEIINLPTLCSLSCFLIILLIKKKDELEKTLFKKFICLYLTFIAGFTAYFIKPNDNTISYDNLILEDWIRLKFFDFLKDYFQNFILNHSILVIFSIILIVVILYINKIKQRRNSLEFPIFIFINFFSLLTFYFSLFLLGVNEDSGYFYIDIFKWQNIYKTITLFYFILIIGYFIDSTLNIESKNSNKIKTILCVFILLIFNQNLVVDYHSNMQKYRYKAQKLREITYICEKEFLKKYNSGEREITITLPKEYETYFNQGDTFFNNSYVENVLKLDGNLVSIIFSEKFLLHEYTQDELNKLKFKK